MQIQKTVKWEEKKSLDSCFDFYFGFTLLSHASMRRTPDRSRNQQQKYSSLNDDGAKLSDAGCQPTMLKTKYNCSYNE